MKRFAKGAGSGLCCSLLMGCLFAAGPTFAANVKTTYNINNSSVTTKTIFQNAPMDMDKDLRNMWDRFSKDLKESSFVSGIQTGDQTESKEDYSWDDYITVKKSFPAFVELKLPESVTLLVKITESQRVCKNPADVKKTTSSHYSDYSSSSSSDDCSQLNSSLKIEGPISIYGTFNQNIDLARMMKNKQSIKLTAMRLDSGKSLKIESEFDVSSVLFEQGLTKFFQVFKVAGVNLSGTGQERGLLSGGTASSVVTRQSIFLGIARIMRQSNERMLNQ